MSVQILKVISALLMAVGIFMLAFYLGGGFNLLIAEKNQDIENPKLINAIPKYKDRRIIPMGNKISVNNLPMDLGYFTTKDDIEELKKEYLERFRSSGLNPYLSEVSRDEAYIHAIDSVGGEQKIIILKKVDDETMVFAGITPTLTANLLISPDTTLGIPAEAENYVEIKNQDYGRYARTISFSLRGGKESNIRLYRDSLRNLGFEENEFFKFKQENSILVFSKEDIQIMVVVIENENEKGEISTLFVLNVMEKKDEKE